MTMHLNGFDADREYVGNLFRIFAVGNQLDHFTLPAGQR
jgi:hypothetical protein